MTTRQLLTAPPTASSNPAAQSAHGADASVATPWLANTNRKGASKANKNDDWPLTNASRYALEPIRETRNMKTGALSTTASASRTKKLAPCDRAHGANHMAGECRD